MDDVTLYCGDCLEILPTLAAGSVDAVVTDPPYGVNKAKWDNQIPPDYVWMEVNRVLKENGSLLVFGGLRYMPDVILSVGKYLTYEWPIAWYKTNAMQFGKTGYSVLDIILWYSKGGAIAKHKSRDVIEYPIIPSENDNGHPTPKPARVMTKLLGMIGGDTILDPFMGSGTTGVACVQTGRKFIGIEIDPNYYAIAQRRIAEAQQQLRMTI
jgi:DNA modification methylase